MSDILEQFDGLLKEDGPAAIIIKQWLKPVGSNVICPPTYANSEKEEKRAVYNVDRFSDGTSSCVIDSIPSQANRIEPIFARIEKGKLVPQIAIAVKSKRGDISVDFLDVGHRAADAIVRFSSIASKIAEAIDAYERHDSWPLAKLAPTSLVFGLWDSRRKPTVKIPRLINSIIRAFNVREYSRKAQYVSSLRDFEAAGVLRDKGDKELSEVGMADVPAPEGLGGVEALGGICRDASLNLCTLRDITSKNKSQTQALQRYILGLSLVAMTYFDGKTLNLRQGCQLVAMPEKPMSRMLMDSDGTETTFEITRESAIAYAAAVAETFGVGPDHMDVQFNAKTAKDSLKKDKGSVAPGETVKA